MDQRTCRSYSLPCFSFPALVDGVNGDVVRCQGVQTFHDGGSGRAGDLQGHLSASTAWDILQTVVDHIARCWCPPDFHGSLSLIRHSQSFTSSGG